MGQHIGIVGCSAPGAALCYESICTEAAKLTTENPKPPEVSLHTHPFSEYMRHIDADNWNAVAELMLSSAQKLALIGADFLIAPCNTIHNAFEMVELNSPLPWLHIAEEVALEAKRLGLRQVALIGTTLMMEGSVYPGKFAQVGVECMTPREDERKLINRIIFEQLVYGKFTVEARSYVLSVVERLRGEGCDAVGMCCTELPLLLGAEDVAIPLLDSTRVLASAALCRAIS